MAAPIQKSAAKTKAATQVVTSNRLIDGVVVYLDASGGWVEKINESLVVEGPEALEAALSTAKLAEEARIVVEAYPIDVARKEGGLKPLRLREEIRAEGPTVRTDLARPVAG